MLIATLSFKLRVTTKIKNEFIYNPGSPKLGLGFGLG